MPTWGGWQMCFRSFGKPLRRSYAPSLPRRVWCAGSAISPLQMRTTSRRRRMVRARFETERLVRASPELQWVLVRPTSIWGPWFGVPYRDFFLNIARGRYMHPAGRRIEKNFGFVGNTTWQLHRLMCAPAADVQGRTLYLGDDPPIEVHGLAKRISETIGRRPPRSVPLVVLQSLARAGDAAERAGIRAPLTTFRLDNLLTPMLFDLGPLMRISGPLPYDEAAGVTATVDWLRQEGLLDTGA